jgi:hypothetical protein
VRIKVKVHPCLDLNFAGSQQKKNGLKSMLIVHLEFVGSFTLIMLLKDKLITSGQPGDPSRIIHVASLMHINSTITPDNFAKRLNGTRNKAKFKGGRAQYDNSKKLQGRDSPTLKNYSHIVFLMRFLTG